MTPMLQTTAHNVGHALIVVLRTTFQTTVLTRPFVSARNTLNHLIAVTPDLQSAVIVTKDSAQETHAHFSMSAYLARALTLGSPDQTGDQLTTANNKAGCGHSHTTYTKTFKHNLYTEAIRYPRNKPSQHGTDTDSSFFLVVRTKMMQH